MSDKLERLINVINALGQNLAIYNLNEKLKRTVIEPKYIITNEQIERLAKSIDRIGIILSIIIAILIGIFVNMIFK